MRGCTPVTLVRTNGALNGSQKLRGLCKPHLQMARGKPGAPVYGAAIGKRGQRLKWANTCRRVVLRPIIRCGHFMVSLPNVTELRWIVVAPTSMVPGWKTWCKTMMMLGIRTRRWRNLQRPSMKCWSLQHVRSMSTLSFVSWMPSHK